jgi:hypothetical protein
MTEGDRALVREYPPGYRHQLLLVAHAKAMLAGKMDSRQRLRILELLHDLTDRHFTESILAVVEPMGPVEIEMYEAALSLDPAAHKSRQASFDVLSGDAFLHFAGVNPSLLTAIRLAAEQRRQ